MARGRRRLLRKTTDVPSDASAHSIEEPDCECQRDALVLQTFPVTRMLMNHGHPDNKLQVRHPKGYVIPDSPASCLLSEMRGQVSIARDRDMVVCLGTHTTYREINAGVASVGVPPRHSKW